MYRGMENETAHDMESWGCIEISGLRVVRVVGRERRNGKEVGNHCLGVQS